MVAVLIFGIFCTRPLKRGASLRVRIPLRWAQKRKAPIAGSLFNHMVGDEGCRVRLAPPAPASGLRPSRAALENAYAFPRLRTLSGSNPMHWAQTKNGPLARTVSKSVVGDEGCPRAASPPAFAAALARLACCAGKRFAFPQLRTLSGSNPMHWALTRKAPHRWEPYQPNGGR